MVIYLTTNLINNKKYIGKDVKNNSAYLGSGILLKKAIKKYGKENFIKTILYECDNLKVLSEMEKNFIKQYDAVNSIDFYNIHCGGDGGNTGNYGIEHRNKISIANRGKKHININPIKYKNSWITRIKNNKSRLSDETKQKISNKHKGKVVSEDTKSKISSSMINKEHNWGYKISLSLKKYQKTNNHRKMLSESGKKLRWVSNPITGEILRINESELDNYIENKWVRGRIKH